MMKNFEHLLGLIVAETPEDKIIKKQQFNIVHKAIEKLSPKHRNIVHLFYWNKLSYRQIANIIDSTPNSVGATLTSIRKNLKNELKNTLHWNLLESL
jgi:RNA polymerase sigma-70 factor (ECF subfamily)